MSACPFVRPWSVRCCWPLFLVLVFCRWSCHSRLFLFSTSRLLFGPQSMWSWLRFFFFAPFFFPSFIIFFFFFYHCCLYWPRFVVCGQFWFAACCHCCFGSPSWLLNSIDDVLTDCLMSFHFLCCRLRSAAQLLTGAAAMNYSCNNHTGAHFVAALLNFFPSLGSMSAALGLHQAIRSDAIRSDPNGRPWSWVSAGSLLSLNVSIDIADYTGQQG